MKISQVKSSLARGKYLHTTRTLKCRKFKAISGERNFEKKRTIFNHILHVYNSRGIHNNTNRNNCYSMAIQSFDTLFGRFICSTIDIRTDIGFAFNI